MLQTIKRHTYALSLAATILVCLSFSLICLLGGPAVALSLYDWAYLLGALAVVLLILFTAFRQTRQARWYVIPCVLVATAALYMLIISWNLCCAMS